MKSNKRKKKKPNLEYRAFKSRNAYKRTNNKKDWSEDL
jgi:hypothetical protein